MREPQIELIAERRAGGGAVPPFDARVLRLNGRASATASIENLRGDAEPVQPVEILAIVGESAARESLEPAAMLDADAHPRRQLDVGECRRRLLR